MVMVILIQRGDDISVESKETVAVSVISTDTAVLIDPRAAAVWQTV